MVNGIIMLKTIHGHERRVHAALPRLFGITMVFMLFRDFELVLDVRWRDLWRNGGVF